MIKELFKTAVCLKPRLIRSGIQRIHSLSNVEEQIDDERLNGGKIFVIVHISLLHDILIITNKHFISILLFKIGGKQGRASRLFRKNIKDVLRQINVGKNIILETYANQFWQNWKTNYEFVYKGYFQKIEELITGSNKQ